jgi:hypothetical protein
VGHIGARPVRHHGSEGSGGLKVQELVALWMRRSAGSGMRARRKKIMGSNVLNPCPTRGFKGASAAPRLQRRTRRVSETLAHVRVRPGETGAHSHDASIPVEYGPATSARDHDGTVTSFTSRSARGTQEPPTTSSGLDLGSSVVGRLSTRAG